ncbi:hypothetical protein FKW77_004479 [Venturia effusa]|uniref:Cytochrome P450 monooxygenase n=1 Tax=Venturia effusa TaxID=50376 RepID=A0A517L179_9PEZI|nr:hypothetical protein FKW77_004479 [Venturia effusa]
MVVSQVSSRIFLGDIPLCRDPRWLSIAINYTVHVTQATEKMRSLPALLRPLLYWLLPETRTLRRTVQNARDLIEPEVEKRERKRMGAAERGELTPKGTDALEWFYEIAKARGRDYDIALGQLQLSFAAIHTTSITLGHVMFDLVSNPEYIPLLREEIISVFKETGWDKQLMTRLKLMDSCLKESQRITPIALVLLNRYTTESISLSDGTTLPKNAQFLVPTTHHLDPTLYPHPTKFNGHRYLSLREAPGEESKHQFVTTNAKQIGFGHGAHACPGRFFASNELKILLVHLLMKYDWKFGDGERPANVTHGAMVVPDPEAVIMRRSRVPEVEL